jgi:hypothetical protein
MILASYFAMRHHFAEVARTTAVSLAYDHGANTITRASGSFVDDGFVEGMSLDVANTIDNDARYTIASASALVITIEEQLNSTETITSSLTGAFYEADGAEVWPIANVRAGGFSSTWSLAPRPITGFPAQLTVNALATDVAAGSSYTWYVRQRTDEGTAQYLSVAHASLLSTGTITLSLTTKATTDLGVANLVKLTPEQQIRILRGVTVFCKRDSDGAIQLVDLLQFSHATVE